MKQKVTVNSVAVATIKFLCGMYDCTVDSDVSTGDISVFSFHIYLKLVNT